MVDILTRFYDSQSKLLSDSHYTRIETFITYIINKIYQSHTNIFMGVVE